MGDTQHPIGAVAFLSLIFLLGFLYFPTILRPRKGKDDEAS